MAQSLKIWGFAAVCSLLMIPLALLGDSPSPRGPAPPQIWQPKDLPDTGPAHAGASQDQAMQQQGAQPANGAPELAPPPAVSGALGPHADPTLEWPQPARRTLAQSTNGNTSATANPTTTTPDTSGSNETSSGGPSSIIEGVTITIKNETIANASSSAQGNATGSMDEFGTFKFAVGVDLGGVPLETLRAAKVGLAHTRAFACLLDPWGGPCAHRAPHTRSVLHACWSMGTQYHAQHSASHQASGPCACPCAGPGRAIRQEPHRHPARGVEPAHRPGGRKEHRSTAGSCIHESTKKAVQYFLLPSPCALGKGAAPTPPPPFHLPFDPPNPNSMRGSHLTAPCFAGLWCCWMPLQWLAVDGNPEIWGIMPPAYSTLTRLTAEPLDGLHAAWPHACV